MEQQQQQRPDDDPSCPGIEAGGTQPGCAALDVYLETPSRRLQKPKRVVVVGAECRQQFARPDDRAGAFTEIHGSM